MRIGLLVFVWLFAAGCSRPQRPLVEDLTAKSAPPGWSLRNYSGTRDGDRLDAAAELSNGASVLTLRMRFQVGSPTTLASGEWTSGGNSRPRPVAARSVTFLGGQSGPPSLGGAFDLLDETGTARYRVNLPVAELKNGSTSHKERTDSRPVA